MIYIYDKKSVLSSKRYPVQIIRDRRKSIQHKYYFEFHIFSIYVYFIEFENPSL